MNIFFCYVDHRNVILAPKNYQAKNLHVVPVRVFVHVVVVTVEVVRTLHSV